MNLPEAKSYKYRGRFFGWGSSPDADWRVMFVIFLMMLLISTLVTTIVFKQVKSGNFGTNDGDQALILDRETLRSTANFYEKRKLDFETFRTMPETTPDPSI